MENKNFMKLSDFVKTAEFKNLPTVTDVVRVKRGLKEEKKELHVHFCNGTYFSDIQPHLIVRKSETEKTIWIIDLDYEVVEGSMQDGSADYELLVPMKDGKVDTTNAKEVRRNRSKQRCCDFYNNGYKLYLTEYPRKYYDPSF